MSEPTNSRTELSYGAVVFHAGFPKTGTTFLLNGVFSQLDFCCLGIRDIYPQSVWDDVVVPRNDDRCRFAPVERSLPTLIAAEGIAGFDRAALIKIRDDFPQAKVLLTVREQRKYIVSLYCHLVSNSHKVPRMFRSYAIKNKQIIRSHINYSENVEKIAEIFGWESVKVIPIESERRSQELFFKELGDFIGADVRGVKVVNDLESNRSVKNRGSSTFRMDSGVVPPRPDWHLFVGFLNEQEPRLTGAASV